MREIERGEREGQACRREGETELITLKRNMGCVLIW